jgi:pimeloyl-ACP methyl ester carboxylesterase
MRILKGLAESFHVVVYDHLAWGLNSRPGPDCSIAKGELEAEQYMIDWMTRTIEAMGDLLPEKFFLSGHSFGGYLSALLASHIPDRIEALLLISPVA